jgi:exopolysaccharide biosynthesis polyprenyl glycosylphosphotransferase
MQISKAVHLTRLLQTQDVLTSLLVFCLILNLAWLSGLLSSASTLEHLTLLPFLLACSVVASVVQTPKLHGQRRRGIWLFAARYTAIVVTGVLAVSYFAHFAFVSRFLLAAFGVALFVALVVNRTVLRWWYFSGRAEHPSNFLKVLVIGSGNRARRLIETYRNQSDWGVDMVGVLDPKTHHGLTDVDGVPILGDVTAIRDVLAAQVIDEVVVCVPRSLLGNIGEIVESCREQAVCLKFMADIYDMPSEALSLQTVGSVPLLSFDPVARDEGKLIVKRIFDLLVATAALLVLLPLFALVAVAIRLDSKGPVLFKQPRVGLNKRIFTMYKFRSMYQDAETRLKEIEHLNEAQGPIFKMARDPRVTRVGRVLRRTSIDELPQLFNVLLGHMSLVGPRPMSLRDVEQFSLGIQRRRFSVRPGLACLREVSGRSRLPFDRWLQLDLEYIDRWSLWLDVKILLRLIPAVIKGDGAS